MAVVGLRILEPHHDEAFEGISTVKFRGMRTDPAPELSGVPLYYRWYSSLNRVIEEGRYYSINEIALAEPDATYSSSEMGMGSHVITFAATDRAEETDADLEAIRHGGVTGGLQGDSPCVIHVFKANILELNNGDSVSRSELVLKAEAPTAWQRRRVVEGVVIEPAEYELNEDYHAYNRVRYRWRFEPAGEHSGRPALQRIPMPQELGFEPDEDPVRVTYRPALPETVTGEYRILLYVEDALGEGLGQDQAEVQVTVME